ncbi:hypothetical protein ElyMa_004190800 [Elysia marginata]|uniref:Uncharacterized protein n=1 Tax=Elysia marginata TaxID=1093978 RepID=A0AAV4GL90_9GAST|nr:hypothetical protein ElyMa_004190800 [Elysia marginata]
MKLSPICVQKLGVTANFDYLVGRFDSYGRDVFSLTRESRQIADSIASQWGSRLTRGRTRDERSLHDHATASALSLNHGRTGSKGRALAQSSSVNCSFFLLFLREWPERETEEPDNAKLYRHGAGQPLPASTSFTRLTYHWRCLQVDCAKDFLHWRLFSINIAVHHSRVKDRDDGTWMKLNGRLEIVTVRAALFAPYRQTLWFTLLRFQMQNENLVK